MRAKPERVKYHHYRLRYGGGLLYVYHLPLASSFAARSFARWVGP